MVQGAVAGVAQGRLVGQGAGDRQPPEHVDAGRIERSTFPGDRTLGRVAAALHRHIADPGQPQPADGQLVAGQRPGLVAGDHRARAQPLHRRQPADDDVAPRHPHRAHGQRHGDRHRQTLGNRRDRQRHGDEEDLGGRHALGVERHPESRHRDDHHEADRAGEPLEADDNRRRRGAGRRQRLGDAADLGVHPGLGDHPGGAAVEHGAAGMDHRSAVADRGLLVEGRVRVLANRQRFAGEQRFVELEVVGREQPDVGGDQRARLETDDIARHQLDAVDLPPEAVADDHRLIMDQPLQGFGAGLRPPLLNGADHRVDLQHREDEQRVGELADRQRNRGGGGQQIDQRALELGEIDDQHAPPFRPGQQIGAERLAPPLRLGVGQPPVAGLQRRQHRHHRLRVPNLVGDSLRFHRRETSPPRAQAKVEWRTARILYRATFSPRD